MEQSVEERRRWMGLLARAPAQRLAAAWQALGLESDAAAAVTRLKAPEVGLVMVRGRAGGRGQRFNLGEMTVTRCAVVSAEGYQGFGYIRGRDKRHAELAATYDALLQAPHRRATLGERLIEPLAREENERRQARAAKAAATRVDFFTLVRGEG